MSGEDGPKDDRSKDGSCRSNALRLLGERGADAVDHLHGNLFDHLRRTERLLVDWEASDEVALAGLCHAFYGTDGFELSLLGQTERNVLSFTVGSDVEASVYFYAACDRKYFYPQIGSVEGATFRDRFTGDIFAPSKEQLQNFADLTLANEADVVLSGRGLGIPTWFASLVDRFGPIASRSVAEACRELAPAR
jgi:hypothetical protein